MLRVIGRSQMVLTMWKRKSICFNPDSFHDADDRERAEFTAISAPTARVGAFRIRVIPPNVRNPHAKVSDLATRAQCRADKKDDKIVCNRCRILSREYVIAAPCCVVGKATEADVWLGATYYRSGSRPAGAAGQQSFDQRTANRVSNPLNDRLGARGDSVGCLVMSAALRTPS